MKNSTTQTDFAWNPYNYMYTERVFIQNRHEILNNIRLLHKSTKINQRSNILSLVAFPELKQYLKQFKFKFTEKQWNTATIKREKTQFTLSTYKRFIPYSKKKLNDQIINKIKYYLILNSREYSNKDFTKYLEKSKKQIYKEYVKDGNTKITYNTFLKYCPKNFKRGKKWTDLCGICELGRNLIKKNHKNINTKDKLEYNRTLNIYEMHRKIVEHQKNAFNEIKMNLTETSCILIVDFKENFKLSFGGNEISHDFYNKRQISCFGAALIFKNNNNLDIEYINYFSNILSHDSLFSSDVVEKIIDEINSKYKSIYIFSDCGPHFRSNEFLYRIHNISETKKIKLSVNFFSEHHGKSVVDSMFGNLSDAFKSVDFKEIKDIHQLRDEFELEYNNREWGKVYFRVYERDRRPEYLTKFKILNLKNYMLFYFNKGRKYLSYLTKNETLIVHNPKEVTIIDKRETSFTPIVSFQSRIKKYFNKTIEKMLLARLS